jgi:hypothetical protein
VGLSSLKNELDGVSVARSQPDDSDEQARVLQWQLEWKKRQHQQQEEEQQEADDDEEEEQEELGMAAYKRRMKKNQEKIDARTAARKQDDDEEEEDKDIAAYRRRLKETPMKTYEETFQVQLPTLVAPNRSGGRPNRQQEQADDGAAAAAVAAATSRSQHEGTGESISERGDRIRSDHSSYPSPASTITHRADDDASGRVVVVERLLAQVTQLTASLEEEKAKRRCD